jgi:hypothetical protein
VIIMSDEMKGAAQAAAPSTSFATYQQARPEKIRDLNDQFRQNLQGGSIVITAGVHVLGLVRLIQLVERVTTFDQFTADNDPYGEHDFGAFEHGGERFFWKIDYFDKSLTIGSPDPTDPDITCRVLTLMLASEY